jgi:outer membrane lipoprotein-sorting protein
MKKFTLFVVTLVLGAAFVQAQDAASIVRAARDRIQSDTMSSRSRMVITAKNGSTMERIIDQYSKEDAQGRARSVIVFQSPSTVKGTRFLTLENTAGDSDQWIFLPGLGKTRRIAASEGGGSFMGSDFSYDDMASSSEDDDGDAHTMIREETLNGNPCYVIQTIPGDKDSDYSKTVSWIDKESLIIYKTEMYNKRGTLTKVMEMSGYRDIQGRLTATQMKVSSVNEGTSTAIFMDIVKYDDPIPDGVFTTAYLETGRVR